MADWEGEFRVLLENHRIVLSRALRDVEKAIALLKAGKLEEAEMKRHALRARLDPNGT
jgi:hypothetical protein